MSIQLSSLAFANGAPVPARHTCDGQDVSPPLSWSGVPQGAKSLCLICEDPDAPAGNWVHWLIYDLSPHVTELHEGIRADAELPDGTRQGINDFRRIGYGGPCPPRGNPHRYFFRLYALDIVLPLKGGAARQDLVRAMEGHVLARGELMGTYRRR